MARTTKQAAQEKAAPSTGQRVGYVRVSSVDQNDARQLDGIALDKVFTDKCSGGTVDRPALQACLSHLREGDELVVHSMDRLARNTEHLLRIVRELTERGVTVRFMKGDMVFSGDENPMSKLMLTMMGAFAEFERNLIRERQREGIEIAKTQGVYKGRKPTLSAAQVVQLKVAVEAGESKVDVASRFGISRQTLYEYLKKPIQSAAGSEDMAHRRALEKRGQGRLV